VFAIAACFPFFVTRLATFLSCDLFNCGVVI
jgi:hypothetical protein